MTTAEQADEVRPPGATLTPCKVAPAPLVLPIPPHRYYFEGHKAQFPFDTHTGRDTLPVWSVRGPLADRSGLTFSQAIRLCARLNQESLR